MSACTQLMWRPSCHHSACIPVDVDKLQDADGGEKREEMANKNTSSASKKTNWTWTDHKVEVLLNHLRDSTKVNAILMALTLKLTSTTDTEAFHE